MDLAEILVTHLSPSLMVFMAMDIYESKPWHIPGGIGYDCFVSSSPPIFRVDMERLFFDGPPWFSWFIPPFCCRFIAKFACFIPSCCDDLQPLFDALSCSAPNVWSFTRCTSFFIGNTTPIPITSRRPSRGVRLWNQVFGRRYGDVWGWIIHYWALSMIVDD